MSTGAAQQEVEDSVDNVKASLSFEARGPVWVTFEAEIDGRREYFQVLVPVEAMRNWVARRAHVGVTVTV